MNSPESKPAGRDTLQLTVDAFVQKLEFSTDTVFMLYDGDTMKAITENFCIKWDAGGKRQSSAACVALFTDLNSDLNSRKIYLVCQVVRLSNDSTEGSSPIRRAFGVAFYNLTGALRDSDSGAFPLQISLPVVECDLESFDSTMQKLIATESMDPIELTSDLNLTIGVDLVHAQSPSVQISSQFKHVVQVRKMGFPKVIVPDEKRNDLYLTLVSGQFGRGENIEVAVSVCKDLGGFLPDVVSKGAGATPVCEYRSVLYYPNDRPMWNETLRIQGSVEDFKRCHLRFTFRSRSTHKKKDDVTFGFAYLRLMQPNGAVIPNQCHQLVVYRVDEKKLKPGLQAAKYLELPSLVTDLVNTPKPAAVGLTLAPKDCFTIETNLCGLHLTQDNRLLTLMNWALDQSAIAKTLAALSGVSDVEIVKRLPQTFDALFEILCFTAMATVDKLAFDCILRVIEIVNKEEFLLFQTAVLDVYVRERFSSKLVHKNLLRVMQNQIVEYSADLNDPDLYRLLRHSQYIIKFISRSRQLYIADDVKRDHSEFENSMQDLLSLFVSFTSSMKMCRSHGAIVKFLHIISAELLGVYSPVKLCEFVMKVLDGSLLSKSKLKCISNLISSKLFEVAECRPTLLKAVCHQIHIKFARREEIDECLQIIHNILDQLFAKATSDEGVTVVTVDDDIMIIVKSLMRQLVQMAMAMNSLDPNLPSMFAVILGIFRCMKTTHYQTYASQLIRTDLQAVILDILSVFEQFVSTSVYPTNWFDMVMHLNTVIAQSLHHIRILIMDQFYAPFDGCLWTKFSKCTRAFIAQPLLQLERFDGRKRSIIMKRYGDLRIRSVNEVQLMWEGLHDNKSAMVLEMVGDFIEISLIQVDQLRTTIIPIFFDMLLSELNSKRRIKDKPLDKYLLQELECKMVNHLDILFEKGLGDVEYHCYFEGILMPLCCRHAEQGIRLVNVVSVLIGRLLEYHRVVRLESPHNRMASIVTLLEYYDQQHLNCPEMYIRYVDKLLALHRADHNLAEAAFTLRLLGRMVEWTDAPLLASQRERWPNCRTHRQLKERLSREIIDCFDRACLWECAIEVCKEMADQFENETFDYRRLNETHTRMMRLSAKIMQEERFESQFFRVAFHGQRFPEFRRNQVFVYRGRPNEMLSEFCARLQLQHPGAQLLQSLTASSESLTKADDGYILIMNAQPISEPEIVQRFAARHFEMPWSFRMCNVRRFGLSRPYRPPTVVEGSDEVVRCLRLQRTEMLVHSALPGILPWSRVQETSVYDVSPLQNVIETAQQNNRDLRNLVNRYKKNPTLPINPLSIKIVGTIHSAPEQFFLANDYVKEHPNDAAMIQYLKALVGVQKPLLEVALQVHRARVSVTQAPMHEWLETCFSDWQTIHDGNHSKNSIIFRKRSLAEEQKQSELHIKTSDKPATNQPRESSSVQTLSFSLVKIDNIQDTDNNASKNIQENHNDQTESTTATNKPQPKPRTKLPGNALSDDIGKIPITAVANMVNDYERSGSSKPVVVARRGHAPQPNPPTSS